MRRSVLSACLCVLSTAGLVCGTVTPVFAQSTGKQWVEAPSAPSPVTGQKRLALIIGNTHYGGANGLRNPENDARSIATALANLGFSSTVLLDVDRISMRDALHAFANQIKAAGSETVALLYYSGHGMQVGGQNYLMPIGFQKPRNMLDIDDYALSAQKAITEMKEANAQVNIVILDACRNNPFADKTRGANGREGLAKLEARGVLIAFATEDGKTASDNDSGKNGLYTTALLENLRKPGLNLITVFKRTQKAVYQASNREQFPYVYDGLIDDDEFYLLPGNTPIVVNDTGKVANTKARMLVSVNASNAIVTVDGVAVKGLEYVTNLAAVAKKTVSVLVTAPGYEDQLIEGGELVRGGVTPLKVTLEQGKPLPLNIKLDSTNETVTPYEASPSPVNFRAPQTLAQYKAQMALIPGGTFQMGSSNAGDDQNPVHLVMIASFKMGRTPVTVGMWKEYCQATGQYMPEPPGWGWLDDHPIVNVSWEDAKAYCDWASLALPTEAQWEYAARGGTGYRYPWGNDFAEDKLVWEKNSSGRTAPVVRYDRIFMNAFGLLDMAGNIWQWCADYYAPYESEPKTNPFGPSSGERKVLRGGTWNNSVPGDFQTTYRGWYRPEEKFSFTGFRCVTRRR